LHGLPADATPTTGGDRLAGVNYDIDYDGAIVKLGNDDDSDGLFDEDTLIGDTDQDSDGSDGEEGNDDPNLIGATIGHNTSFLLNGANDFSKANGFDTATWSDFHSSYFKLSGFAVGPKSGVLERITVKAVGTGVTTLNLRDGANAAPTLGDDASANFTIGNGGAGDAQIAVSPATCPTPATPTATATATPAPGTITIIKDAVPNDAQDFPFSGDCFAAFSLDDDADGTLLNTKTAAHAAGTCTVVENAPAAGWNLTNLVCTDPTSNSTVNIGTRTATINLAGGETVSCTYTNTKDGTITINKDAVPNDPQDFSFSGTCFGAFSLDDDADGALSNIKTAGHAPGTCTVVESSTTGWILTSAGCSDPSNDTSIVFGTPPVTVTITIALAAGESVSCNLRNAKNGTIVVQKTTDPPGDSQSFGINLGPAAIGSGDVTDAADLFFTDRPADGYTLTETVPIGWAFGSATCDGGSPTQGTNSVSFTLAAGQTVTCTFNNTKNGTITIVKDAQPNDAQDFTFGGSLGGTCFATFASFSLDDDSDPTLPNTTSAGHAPGTCTVIEAATTGWTLTNIVCTDPTSNSTGTVGTRTASINLAAGEHVTCTFTNTQVGAITIIKDAQPNDPQDFSFSGSFGPFALDDDSDSTLPNSRTFLPQGAGQLSVTEAVPVGWVLSDASSCTSAGGTSSGNFDGNTAFISFDGTNGVTCTFTNVKDGALTIIKDAVPDDAQDFSFSGTCFAAFSLDDDTDITLSNTKSASHAPGACTVIENAPAAGWNLTALVCTDPTSNSTVNIGTRTASINIAPGEAVSCTFTNTKEGSITINKNAVPDDAQNFAFSGTCFTAFSLDDDTDVTLSNTRTAGHAASTCTVIEDAVPGWTLDGIDCTDPSGGTTVNVGTRTASINLAAGENVTCTFTNRLNQTEFHVAKIFSDQDEGSVNVTLLCTTGRPVVTVDGTASMTDTADFIVSGFNEGTLCTATEDVPNGYTVDQTDCQDVPIFPRSPEGNGFTGGENGFLDSCTIFNTFNSTRLDVFKDFADDNEASVDVTLECTSGEVTTERGFASELGGPAIFFVDGYNGGATCTATETVPEGYAARENDCVDVSLPPGRSEGYPSCTIFNVAAIEFDVFKDFSDDNPAEVVVEINCTEGELYKSKDLLLDNLASESDPANFFIQGSEPDTTCTVTEPNAPAGYQADLSDCQDVLLVPEGEREIASCTIINNLNTARFVVEKDFSDGNTASVTVTLSCDGESVSPPSASASESTPAVFTVTGFTGDPGCTASESLVPNGYSSTGNCSAALSVGHCTIFNNLNTAQFLVRKDFSDNSTASVTVSLSCASGNASPPSASASEGTPAAFTVTGFTGNPLCTGTESPVPAGYISIGNCSANLTTGTCTIVNTLRTGDFQVLKDFQPDSAASVSVSLSCGGGGNVSPGSGNASESTPATFTVSGHTGDPTCTATEASVPGGYSSSDTCSAALSVGHCTIVNILNTDEFTVNKDFSDNSAASVTVSLTCPGANVSPASLPASEASGALFTVTGFTGDPACNASETLVPAGYTSTGTCSAALSAGGCTIVNTFVPTPTPTPTPSPTPTPPVVPATQTPTATPPPTQPPTAPPTAPPTQAPTDTPTPTPTQLPASQTPKPTVLPDSGAATPTPSPTPSPTVAQAVRLPTTGGTPNQGSQLPLVVALGLLALAISAAAYAGYRRTEASS
ncbi:MAG: hypothetical protein Q7T33_03520, partial [Dehalococcoidia bacterium]|nr:hypothetical protein [Dehalococcoidia bacterium]